VKIKRYMAASMRAALSQVRAEQGPDAVILSSRRVSEGIEVIAAVDYDAELIAGARQHLQPMSAAPAPAPPPAAAPPAPPAPPRAAPQATARPATARPAAAAPPPAARPGPATPAAAKPATAALAPQGPVRKTLPPQWAQTVLAARQEPAPRASSSAAPDHETRLGLATVHRELKDLRQLIESELPKLTRRDKHPRDPSKARLLEQLSAMDIAPDVAVKLAERSPLTAGLGDPSNVPLALLIRHLPVVERLSAANCGVFAIVGPAGAGKTTTVAKLAARWVKRYGTNDLALVSTDTNRVEAREQLTTYARVLGAPIHTANGHTELARLLDSLKSKRLVLIDTPGMGPRDSRLTEQLATLKLSGAPARVLLALPAQADGVALEEIVRAFSPVSPAACILTKLDEAMSLGAALSTTLRHQLKIAYLCDGRQVPENLHLAHQRRLWLVLAAHDLKERAQSGRDLAYLARNSNRAPAHA
jgi:flagellar biosynthesis protein FlhF